MSTNLNYQPIQSLTIQAGGTIAKHRLIGFDGNYPSANAKGLGVTELDGVSGDLMNAISLGTCVIETSGTIAVGSKVGADTSGKAKVYATGDVIGVALTGVTGAGYIVMKLIP